MKNINNIIFECPELKDKAHMEKAIKSGKNVYVLEPFCAYHHRRFRFFPSPLPEYVQNLLDNRIINQINADSLESRTISLTAAEKAVEAVEKVFSYYQKDHKTIIDYTIQVLNSREVLRIFKKNLCDMLGDFFSLNIMFYKIEKIFKGKKVLIFPNTNIKEYLYFKRIARYGSQVVFEHHSVLFPKSRIFSGLNELIRNSFLIKGKLLIQALASLVLGTIFSKGKSSLLKKYSYAISIVSPNRQFRNDLRGPDFLIDNRKITSDQVVYIPIIPIANDQLEFLTTLDSDVNLLPEKGRFFSNGKQWAILWLLSFKGKWMFNSREVELVAVAMFNYFRWKHILKHIHFSNFITHCDFSITHISRNILFKQKKIKTWYFTDAVNFGHNFRESDEKWNRHPFWTYMYYDNFVTWYNDLATFFTAHPQSFKKTHVVGCIWGSHVKSKANNTEYINNLFPGEKSNDSFIVAVYPSTYTVKGITSYEEAIRFIRHIYRLAKDLNNLKIIIKEKKDMDLHLKLEPILGKKLVALYKKMEKHPRIKILTNEFDSSLLMSYANMCISFPFTSTTTEALSANMKAIWHDPTGSYRNTPYGRNGSVLTYNYNELLKTVKKFVNNDISSYDLIPVTSKCMDPYRDGKAVERFRDLLIDSNN